MLAKKFISVAEGAGSLCNSFCQRAVYGELAFKMRMERPEEQGIVFPGEIH